MPAIAGISIAIFLQRFRHRRGGYHRAHPAGATGDGFGQAQHVRLQPEMLAGEEPAGPAEAAGHLVGNEERASAGACRAHAPDEFAIRNRDTEVDADRLNDESRDVAFSQHRFDLGSGLAVERWLYLPAMR